MKQEQELEFGNAKQKTKPTLLSRMDKPVQPQVVDGVGGKITHKGVTLLEYYSLEIYKELIRKSDSSSKIIGDEHSKVTKSAVKLAKSLINAMDDPTT